MIDIHIPKDEYGSMRLYRYGRMCVVGHILHKLGVPKEEMEDLGGIKELLVRHPSYRDDIPSCMFNGDDMSDETWQLMIDSDAYVQIRDSKYYTFAKVQKTAEKLGFNLILK